jgi:plasmid maintenance system antidote protein VapI
MAKTITIEVLPQNDLLDILKDELGLKYDAALSRELGISKPELSKIRHGKLKVKGDHILKIYDATGWSIEKIRGYLPGSSIEG